MSVRIERIWTDGLPSGGVVRMLRLEPVLRLGGSDRGKRLVEGVSSGMKSAKSGWLKMGAAMAVVLMPALAVAQSCTTQAKLNGLVRTSVADAAMALALDVKADSVAKLKAEAIEEYAANFTAANALIDHTAAKLGGDTLQVTQVYLLDARNRKSTDQGDAEFNCPLADSTAETDFSISGLPPGMYAFVMVEGTGNNAWLISMLLRQDAGHWKLAGLYPHARKAEGHDGVWYWTKAREAAKANQIWYAWLLYGEADQLLRPANFVGTTNLDKLHSEQRTATPPELADGISAENPLVLKGAGAAQFRLTSVSSEGSEDGSRLNLVLHYVPDAALVGGPQAMAQNAAAAGALLNAHKELRDGFDSVIVIAEVKGQSPFVTEQKIDEIH
jgi:hypothetical protein